ncbi:FAD-dependent monooxygenase, partial [Francisellaceae bacterium]|nr:FAD-dependent monooxygenase [Francisellaceae bacterium]
MTEDTLHYDAVVVGGGLVGQLLALVLAKENNTVAMIEQRALPSKYTDDFDNRGIALAYPSLCMLNTLGLWQKLSSYATAIHHVHVSNKGSLPQVNLNREGLPGLGAVVETPHLLTVLSEAVSKSKIEVIAPAEV